MTTLIKRHARPEHRPVANSTLNRPKDAHSSLRHLSSLENSASKFCKAHLKLSLHWQPISFSSPPSSSVTGSTGQAGSQQVTRRDVGVFPLSEPAN